ncbi:hypothetical protein [Vibrio sp. AND4]|uniref:hypothetical protein n=1 Tax=Vibrio sp. AND4 TaxID=314289 RepID=UPI00015EFB61|nr:hypothetical protein [Vibrio sp. AND4]EDP60133.1 hypothetical protein AND4_01953 [Vibrio sp. AND4]
MAKSKRIAIVFSLLIVIFLFLFQRSLGSYFSAYAHFAENGHEVIVNAKSGVFKAVSLLEGKPYKTNSGLYIIFGKFIYFISFDISYDDKLDPDFFDRAIDNDFSMYTPGLLRLEVYKENDEVFGNFARVNREAVVTKLVFTGRIKQW